MEVSGQLHAPAALPRGKSPRHPLGVGLGEPQSRSGRCGEERNVLPLPGIEHRLLARNSSLLINACIFKMSYHRTPFRDPTLK
jgi:hypothetical protein